MSEVQQFFSNVWAPMVCRLHTPGGSILPLFFTDLIGALENLSIQEVGLEIIITGRLISLGVNEPKLQTCCISTRYCKW